MVREKWCILWKAIIVVFMRLRKSKEANRLEKPVENGESPISKLPNNDVTVPSSENNALPLKSLKSKPPSCRGGRPRSEISEKLEKKPAIGKCRSQPELVCFEKNGVWEIGIKIPSKLSEDNPCVFIGTEEIYQDEEYDSSELFYRLPQVTASIVVKWGSDEKIMPIWGDDLPCLIFKTRAKWGGEGRLIKKPTKGCCVILARDEYIRIGTPPIEPVESQYPRVQVHYFNFAPGGEKDGFCCDKEEIILSADSRFSLEGKNMEDDSPMGPIFLGDVPSLQDAQSWRGVGIVVVGEERGGRNKWRDSFHPEEKPLDELLSEKSGGWYFVRIYDERDELLDSMDFRFMRKLTKIKINADLLPSSDGHHLAKIEFNGDCEVEMPDGNSYINCRKESGRIVAEIQPIHSADKTKWRIKDGDTEITAEIVVPRIWWVHGLKESSSSQLWTDKLLELLRDRFAATSEHGIYIKLPRPGFVKEVRAGFSALKSYTVTARQECLFIPLREFGGIRRESGACEWKIMFEHDGKTIEAAVIKISSTDSPTDSPTDPVTAIPPSDWQIDDRVVYLDNEAVGIYRGIEEERVADGTISQYVVIQYADGRKLVLIQDADNKLCRNITTEKVEPDKLGKKRPRKSKTAGNKR